LTELMHRFPEDGPFGRRMQIAKLDYLAGSRAMQTAIAENYVGLPLQAGTAMAISSMTILTDRHPGDRSDV